MDHDIAAILDFIDTNRKSMAAYVRQRLVAAGAGSYLDTLGKGGIEALENEAAGVLLDLACAMCRRLRPDSAFEAELILAKFPEPVRRTITLPRSDAYHSVMAPLESVDNAQSK